MLGIIRYKLSSPFHYCDNFKASEFKICYNVSLDCYQSENYCTVHLDIQSGSHPFEWSAVWFPCMSQEKFWYLISCNTTYSSQLVNLPGSAQSDSPSCLMWMPRPVYELLRSVSLFFGSENQWGKESTGVIIILKHLSKSIGDLIALVITNVW